MDEKYLQTALENSQQLEYYVNDEFDEDFDDDYDLDDDMKLKKWMLSHAIDRAHDDLGMTILYVRDDVTIPANQIISIKEL